MHFLPISQKYFTLLPWGHASKHFVASFTFYEVEVKMQIITINATKIKRLSQMNCDTSVNFTKVQHCRGNIFLISYKHIKNPISCMTENEFKL